MLLDYVKDKLRDGVKDRKWRVVLDLLRKELTEDRPFDNVMPWFAQGIDAADGRFYLGRKWTAPWRRELKLDWDSERSKAVIEGIAAKHVELSKATGGTPWLFPTWTVFKDLITPHPLGGCNMGSSASDGVVDHGCRVFGYPNLWVVDGAVVPEAIGRNPSRTIAALAERAAALVEL